MRTEYNRTYYLDPWLASTISLLVPGIGQICLKRYGLGFIWLILGGISLLLFFLSLLIDRCPVSVTIVLAVVMLPLIQLLASLDAYRVSIQNKGDPKSDIIKHGKNAWLAVYLSLIFPGLGHLYLRKWLFFVAFSALNIVLYFLNLHQLMQNILTVIFRVFVMSHAYFYSRTTTPKSTWLFLCVIFALLLLPFLKECTYILVGHSILQFGEVESNSMKPTLIPGEKVVVDKVAYWVNDPKPGDLVSAVYGPIEKLGTDSKLVIKRVAAVEGEKVYFKNDILYVNDAPRVFIDDSNSESPGDYKTNEAISAETEAIRNKIRHGIEIPYIVPEKCYFLIGDNQDNSFDSRITGAFPRKYIQGKVTKVIQPITQSRLLY